jgi:hypothetical protein
LTEKLSRSQDSLRDVAREVVLDLAPDEADLFDQLWDDLSRDPTQTDTKSRKQDRALGAGIDAEMAMTSLVIIPLVIELAKDAANATVTQLVDLAFDFIKKRRTKPGVPSLSDKDVGRIARAVANRLSRPKR